MAVEAVNGIVFDITDRKQAEDDLEAPGAISSWPWRAKIGVWSLDPKTGASWFSDRARDLVGLESNVVAQPRDYKKHVHPDDWDELFRPMPTASPTSRSASNTGSSGPTAR